MLVSTKSSRFQPLEGAVRTPAASRVLQERGEGVEGERVSESVRSTAAKEYGICSARQDRGRKTAGLGGHEAEVEKEGDEPKRLLDHLLPNLPHITLRIANLLQPRLNVLLRVPKVALNELLRARGTGGGVVEGVNGGGEIGEEGFKDGSERGGGGECGGGADEDPSCEREGGGKEEEVSWRSCGQRGKRTGDKDSRSRSRKRLTVPGSRDGTDEAKLVEVRLERRDER
jgi:hypothetical protein